MEEHKHAGGRPPLFSTPEDLQIKIDDYFAYVKGECHEEEKIWYDKKSKEHKSKEKVWDRDPEPLTITGLALYIGFASRQSFYDYEKDGEFSYAIKRARLKIEQSYEFALHGTSPTGAIFALKNFGWTDKQEVEQKTTIEDKRLDLSNCTDEELRTLAEIQRKCGAS